MKIRIILYALCLSFITFSSTGCSNDDDVVEFNKNVILDIKDIEIDPGEEAIVKITDGNGGYSTRSTNETIATGTVDGANVKIEGHQPGIASLIISDNKGVNSVVKVLVYGNLTLETEVIDILISSSAKIRITSGNGDYRIESLNNNLNVSLETDKNGTSYIVVNSNDVELTEAVITIFDKTMRSASIKVNVKDPYTMIKDDATQRIQFRNRIKTLGTAGITFYNDLTTNPGYRTFGWYEATYKNFYIRIPESIDLKEVGKKAGAQFKYYYYSYTDDDRTYIGSWTAIDADPGLEVIKYDQATGLVWIVFHHTRNGATSQGIVCMKI